MMENNKNELVVKGKTKISGIEVPNIYGGFSGNQKVMLVKTISELHKRPLGDINKLINDNIKDFEIGIDILDLKGDKDFAMVLIQSEIYTKNALNASKSLFLLSQQGYTILLKLLESELAMKQYKIVIRDYFKLKEEKELKETNIIYLTHEEVEQLVTRKDGTIRRNREVHSISTFIQNGELPNNRISYAKITNLTYDILFGMYAKEIKEHLDLRQQDNLRDFLSTPDLSLIREIEDEIHWMCKKGYTWREIYRDLVKEYPDQIEPVRAEKSIKELKKAKRFAIDSNEFKKLT